MILKNSTVNLIYFSHNREVIYESASEELNCLFRRFKVGNLFSKFT
jgi:hypothetical protein